MSFKDLKKKSSLGALTQKLVKEVEKLDTAGSSGDDRFWKLECDKAQNGSAVIRFLPPPDGEDMPFVMLHSHYFKGPGGWYVENSRTTLGRNENDPVGDYNRSLVQEHGDGDFKKCPENIKEIVRNQKRKTQYFANILVIKDPSNPQNEGEVFLYSFGKKIYEKIMSAMQPEFEDEEAINPFEFWEGANFRLKAKSVSGYRNYDSSYFGRTEALLGGDNEALEAVYNKQYSLADFVTPDKFKPYDELKKRFEKVQGLNVNSRRPVAQEDTEQEDIEEQLKSSRPAFKKEVAAYSEPELPSTATPEPASSEDDDALSWFQSLSDDD